jgi:hypothetical protein
MAPRKAPRPRYRAIRAYPLVVDPRDWEGTRAEVEEATQPTRVERNIWISPVAGWQTPYVVIHAGSTGDLVHLRFARLSKEAIEKINTRTGKDGVVEALEDELFAESSHVVLDIEHGLAMGEYRDRGVQLLGKMPGTLLTHALKVNHVDKPVQFRPIPTVDFFRAIVGRAVKQFTMRLGPVSPSALEAAGLGGRKLDQFTLGNELVGLDITLRMKAETFVDEKAVGRLRQWKSWFEEMGARRVGLKVEDDQILEMLDDNLIQYQEGFEVVPGISPAQERNRTFSQLKELYLSKRVQLLRMVPQRT